MAKSTLIVTSVACVEEQAWPYKYAQRQLHFFRLFHVRLTLFTGATY